ANSRLNSAPECRTEGSWRRRRDSNTPISPWVFQIFKGLPTCVPTRWCTNSDAAEMPSLHISENGRQPIMQSAIGVAMPSEPDAEIHDGSLHSASQSIHT